MKTTLSIVLVIFIMMSGFSQKRVSVKNSLKYYTVEAERGNPIDGSEIIQRKYGPVKTSTLLSEEEIGETWYDKQSNRAVANRIYMYSDGTMAATWTFSLESTGFTDRGAAYNYFDGSEWGSWPDTRVESVRCGWPSYAPLGENGEIIVSHDAVDELFVNRRADKGTGAWTETTLQGPPGNEKITWPRVTTSGVDNNIVHILGIIRDLPGAGDFTLGYYRSMDGGEDWDIMNYEIPGTTHDEYNDLGADSYTFAEPRNGIIAFFVANTWCDAFIMKSDDDGDTWDQTIVWEHPYPFYDDNTIFTDTLWAPDNSGHIALDNDGKAHVVFGLAFVLHDEVGTTYSHFPGYQDGIVYWNEDMDPLEDDNQHDALDPYDVLEEDYNLIGWTQDVNNNGTIDLLDDIISYSETGLSTMPNISIDEGNRIFVVWASTTETYDNGLNNFKHIWARTSLGPDIGWSIFHDLTDGIIHLFDECVYPQLTANTDDNMYLMYNFDGNPGNAIDGDHEFVQNKENFVALNKDEILGINQPVELSSDQVSQNYPNPFSDVSNIRVELKKSATLHLEVFDLLGKKVFETPLQKAAPGTHIITIDAGSLTKGIYTYSVFADEVKVSKKMVIK